MLLARLVETSRRIADTSKRLEKIALLGSLLHGLAPDEAAVVTAFLSARTRQGTIGVGCATLRGLRGGGAEIASLETLEVDRILGEIRDLRGSGSSGSRSELLVSLFARATAAERGFLAGLLTGELRQGALEGIMADGLAKAYELPPGRVRRAIMMAGDIAVVAKSIGATGSGAL